MADNESPIDRGSKHKLRLDTRRGVITLSAIIVVLAAFFIYLSYVHDKPSGIHASGTTKSSTKPTSAKSDATTKSSSSSTGSNKLTAKGSSTVSGSSTTNTTTTGPCSSVLTASQAKTVLGVSNPSASSSNGTTSQATDTTIVTCAYTSGSDSASIAEHKANTPTGQHENDDQFGSARPSGVTVLSGYGQSAYWQSSTGLNVLQANNWYVVSFSNGGSMNESQTTQLAKVAQL